MQFDRARFPLLAAYLDGLPDGLASYPDCTAKAAMLPFVLKRRPFVGEAAALPPRLAELLERPPLPTQWIPETEYLGLNLAIADQASLSATQCQALWRQIVLDMTQSRLYSIILTLLRPARMIRSASQRWNRFHRGTSLTVADAGGHFVVRMEYPPHLLNRYLAESYTGVLQAIARSSATSALDVTFVDAAPDHALWALRRGEPSWHPTTPR
ncbi:MAG: hypothetical protein ACRBN8_32380 [Nannocystales bacterium]